MLHGDARSRNFYHVWLHSQPTTLCREKNPSELLLALPMAGIKPGPLAQQASTLSITPLPLGRQDLNCFHPLIAGIVLGVIGAIVAIGLALILMWKVFTTIHDRREFARFEKERMMAKWDTVSSISINSIWTSCLNKYIPGDELSRGPVVMGQLSGYELMFCHLVSFSLCLPCSAQPQPIYRLFLTD